MTRRYNAQYNDAGVLVAIGTGPGGVEITEAEYNALLAEIVGKAQAVEQLYAGEIEAADVPDEWRAEVERRVAERIEAEGEAAQQEISGEELAAMLEEVL